MKFFKRLSILVIFCFVIVLGADTAHADTYTLGAVTFVGNINGSSYTPSGNIVVTGSISNTNPYSAIPAYLTATTNGSTKTVVSQQTISAGGSSGTYDQSFQAPSTPGSYSVAMSAAANLPAAQEVVDFNISIWRYMVQDGKPVVALSVQLAQALTQSITLYVDDEYWDSYVNGPNTVGFTVTIPAGQTGSSIVSVEYLYPSTASNTYISSNGQYTGVNGTGTSELLSGTLVSAYGNTKLRLTNSSVNYFFQCGPLGGGFSCQ